MARPKRPAVQPEEKPKRTMRPGFTKLTLVVPETFAARFRGFSGWTGQDLSEIVVEQVGRHLDRRGFPTTMGGDRPPVAQEPSPEPQEPRQGHSDGYQGLRAV